MRVIKPNPITLLSTTIPENDEPVWSSSTTYKTNDRVMYEHRIYRSHKDGNVNNIPPKTTSGTSAAWQDLGATNMWRMFDDSVSSQSWISGEGQVSITFSVKFRDASSFALLNLSGGKVKAEVHEEGSSTPYWSKEVVLVEAEPDWWEWYFEDQKFSNDFVALDIPPSKFGILTVTLTGAENVGIGHFTHGKQQYVGKTLRGMTPSLRSYGKKDTNEFGDTTFVPRKSAKRFSGELYVLPRNSDSVYRLLVSLDTKLALWIGDDLDALNGGYQSLSVFGWVEEFHEALNDVTDVRISITIQGLT